MSDLFQQFDLQHPAVIVDCNHANSGKNPFEQIRIANKIVQDCKRDTTAQHLVKGLMIESYIEDGACSVGEYTYGKSITDPCLGWEKTERLILDLADKL